MKQVALEGNRLKSGLKGVFKVGLIKWDFQAVLHVKKPIKSS